MYKFIFVLIASLTFPSGTVEYRITGIDNCGQSFSALLPGLVPFKETFSVEIYGEDPVIIEPGQFLSLKVTVRNFLKTEQEFNLESEQVDEFRQIFSPSNSDKLTVQQRHSHAGRCGYPSRAWVHTYLHHHSRE